MKQKQLILLTAVAVLLVALAYLSGSGRRVGAPSMVGKPLLEKLDISEVARLEISAGGTNRLSLSSSDKGWQVVSLHNYPADITKIRENLLKLKDLKIGHIAADKQLIDPILVDLQDSGGKSMATVMLGEKHMRQSDPADQYGGGYPDGRYLSAAGSGDAVALVKETLEPFEGDAKSWLDNRIASISSSEIIAVELTSGQEQLKLTRKDGNWELEGLKEKEEFDSSKGYALESALSYLNFTEVIDPALTEAELGLSTGALYKVELKSGESYTARIGSALEDSSDRYFKIAASFSAPGTNEVENAATEKKVKEFNESVAKWTYAISSYSADNMRKRRSDLVKVKEEPKQEDKEQQGESK